MALSARNQLVGTISNIQEGAVNGVVTIKGKNNIVKADITMEAIKDLKLKEGMEVAAIIKATNVMFATGSERLNNISARNQLAGTVTKVQKGAVNGHVVIELPCGQTVSGSITNEAIDELGLKEGAPALAIIKSTDVMVATL